jgi:hypothetical protein
VIRSEPWDNPNKAMMKELKADADGNFYIKYGVWICVIKSADVVELGSPYVAGQQQGRDRYGIAVKALP